MSSAFQINSGHSPVNGGSVRNLGGEFERLSENRRGAITPFQVYEDGPDSAPVQSLQKRVIDWTLLVRQPSKLVKAKKILALELNKIESLQKKINETQSQVSKKVAERDLQISKSYANELKEALSSAQTWLSRMPLPRV